MTAARKLESAGAPDYLVAIFEALRFETPATERFRKLSFEDWARVCEWCDARQLTFMLPELLGEALPVQCREHIARCRERYLRRFSRLKAELFEITDALNGNGIEFVLLKGLSHSPALTCDPSWRAQGDIDLWFLPRDIPRAYEVLTRLKYVPGPPEVSRHLAPMTRLSDWKWRGDRYDPEMPVSVEIHYELWSEKAEYIPVAGLDDFWQRKRLRDFDGRLIHVLSEPDLLGFAALHLLLHLLHAEFPAQRAWELGSFLHRTSKDELFWARWRELHPPSLMASEILIFQLVRTWFGCDLPPIVESGAERLPGEARLWLDEFSVCPLMQTFRPNKHELWLQLALIPSSPRKAWVAIRRLFPLALPTFVDQSTGNGFAPAAARLIRQRKLIMARFVHHAVTLWPTIVTGLRRHGRSLDST